MISKLILIAADLKHLDNANIPRNPSRDFIQVALGNAACFHVLMATVLQVQRFQGRPGGPCFWYHRGGAIAALNNDLSHRNLHITDEMIYTTGMLAFLDVGHLTFQAEADAIRGTDLES